MNEKQFQTQIRECGLTEFKVDIRIVGRVGDMHPGWAINNVKVVTPTAIARAGIMVDECEVKMLGS